MALMGDRPLVGVQRFPDSPEPDESNTEFMASRSEQVPCGQLLRMIAEQLLEEISCPLVARDRLGVLAHGDLEDTEVVESQGQVILVFGDFGVIAGQHFEDVAGSLQTRLCECPPPADPMDRTDVSVRFRQRADTR